MYRRNIPPFPLLLILLSEIFGEETDMNNALTVVDGQSQDAQKYEQAFIMGDLNALSDTERLQYYLTVCQSLGLNPATRPLEFLRLQGQKLTLYARKDCTDQLRALRGVSVNIQTPQFSDGLCVVAAVASDRTGRQDSDLGIVTIGNLQGDARANAIMKAVTKAKRRVTLSICGLGMLDETEIETIPDAKPLPMNLETGALELPESTIVETQEQPQTAPAKTLKELSEEFKRKAGEYQFSSSRNSDYARLLTLLLDEKEPVTVTRETLIEGLDQIETRWKLCIKKMLADLTNEQTAVVETPAEEVSAA